MGVQMCVDVFHGSVAKIPNESIREYMRSHFKKPHVSVFGVKKYYGGGRTRGYCVIYDNEESMKKYEPKYRAKRVTIRFFVFVYLLRFLYFLKFIYIFRLPL